MKISGKKLKSIAAASFCIITAAANVIGYVKDSGDVKIDCGISKEIEERAGENDKDPKNIEAEINKKEEAESREAAGAEAAGEEKDQNENSGKIDINTANSEELQTVKGIGPKKAEAILDYRKRYGGFTCIDELTEVKGIGTKTLEKLKPFLCVGVE